MIEAAGGGHDTVYASAGYQIGAEIENLVLTDFATYGWGNDGDNVITGNDHANGLRGGKGDDTLDGGIGYDTYIVNNAADSVLEGFNKGHDTALVSINSYTLAAGVEDMTFVGGGNFAGTGNVLNNKITGGAGKDTLDGGDGADTLTGGGGSDTFAFAAGQANGDQITDFVSGVDHLVFSGFGTAAAGATLLQLNATDWKIIPAGGGVAETIHFTNAAAIAPADYHFV